MTVIHITEKQVRASRLDVLDRQRHRYHRRGFDSFH